MNLKLSRNKSALYGIESTLSDESGNPIGIYTLEHAYPDGKGGFIPKLPPGMYRCIRGIHRLENGIPFETFEITGVPPFMGVPVTGLLFHKGNWNIQSKGCCLLGLEFGSCCILESGKAFDRFMELQTGVNEFTLVVV